MLLNCLSLAIWDKPHTRVIKEKKSQAQLDKEETGKTWSPIKEQGQAEKQPSENQCKWDFLLSFIDVKLYHGTLPKVL